MNTDNANKYLDERQIYQRDVWDSKDIEHPLDCLLEDYHQKQLKLLGIADVSNRYSIEDIEKCVENWGICKVEKEYIEQFLNGC